MRVKGVQAGLKAGLKKVGLKNVEPTQAMGEQWLNVSIDQSGRNAGRNEWFGFQRLIKQRVIGCNERALTARTVMLVARC